MNQKHSLIFKNTKKINQRKRKRVEEERKGDEKMKDMQKHSKTVTLCKARATNNQPDGRKCSPL